MANWIFSSPSGPREIVEFIMPIRESEGRRPMRPPLAGVQHEGGTPIIVFMNRRLDGTVLIMSAWPV